MTYLSLIWTDSMKQCALIKIPFFKVFVREGLCLASGR